MIKELVKDLTKYAPSLLVPAVVSFLSIPFITHFLSPGEYGDYILVIAAVALLSAIATSWLSSSVIRFFPYYNLNNRLEGFLCIVFKLVILSLISISVIFLALLFFAGAYISDRLITLMRIGVLVFIATSLWRIILDLLRAKRSAALYSYMTIWSNVAGLGCGLALVVLFHNGADGLLWGLFLSMAVALPLIYKLGKFKFSFKESSINSSTTAKIARYGFPVMAVNLFGWMITLSDRYLIQLFRGNEEVGIYAASSNISAQILVMLSTLFLLVQGPIAFNVWERQGAEESGKFINKLTRYYLLIAIPAFIGLSVLSKPLVSLVLAPEYFQGYRIIPLVVSGSFLIGIINSFNAGLSFHKKTDMIMYCTIGSAILGIGLNLLLIPKLGYIGAAVALLITWIVDLILIIIVSRRFFTWHFPFRSLVKITGASVIMAAVVYPVSNGLTSSITGNLIVAICFGIAVYALMLLLLKEFQKEEIEEVYAIGRKLFRR